MQTNGWIASALAAWLAVCPIGARAEDRAQDAQDAQDATDDRAPATAKTAEVLASSTRPEKPPIVLVESGPFKMKDKRGYRNLLILGPRLIPPGIGGRYIRSIDDHISLMVGGGYSGWSLFGATLRHVDARAGLDYQPIGNGMHGFYVGPRVVYRSFLGAFESDSQTSGIYTRTIGAGGVMGWRAIWNPGISVGGGIGATYTTFLAGAGDLSGEDNDAIEITGLAPSLEFTVGFAF